MELEIESVGNLRSSLFHSIVLNQSLFVALLLFVMLFCSVRAIITKKPIESILYLIFLFMLAALLLLYLNAAFLSVIIFILYVGAISILFLFVVMMFDLRIINANAIEMPKSKVKYSVYGSYFSVTRFIFYVLLTEIHSFFAGFTHMQIINIPIKIFNAKNIYIFGEILYNQFGVYVIFIGFILLTAMLTCVILTLDSSYKGVAHIKRSYQPRLIKQSRIFLIKNI
jgi:NADH-quinone oxidoreductase subunit J